MAALLWPVAALWAKATHAKDVEASTKPAPAPAVPTQPTQEQALMGMRSMLEVCTRLALESEPSLVILSWSERLQSAWNEGDWLKLYPDLKYLLPWKTFANFEAVANAAVSRCWHLAGPRLMLLVHGMGNDDLLRVIRETKTAPPKVRWATMQLERQTGAPLYTLLLGEVIEVQLEWLKNNQDRYPRMLTPRNAQVEQAHLEACQRIARAIIDTIYLSIAMQENTLRQTAVQDLNTYNHTATIVSILGEAPTELPFPIRERPVVVDLREDALAPVPKRVAVSAPKPKKPKKKTQQG